MTWPTVLPNDDGIRPAGKPDECFYCHRKVGQLHKEDCVTITKLVRLRYIIEVDIEMPHSFDAHDIEFNRNEGSWCADNCLDEIEAHCRKEENVGSCLCNRFKAEFVSVLDSTPRQHTRDGDDVNLVAGDQRES